MKHHLHLCRVVIFDLIIIEFGPLAAFIVGYYYSGFSAAALWLAISTVVTLTLSRAINCRIPWFGFSSGTITIIMSLFTYWYKDPYFLIVTDTFFYLFFAIVMAISIIFERNYLKLFFGHITLLTKKGWHISEMHWFFFFSLAAAANEYVRAYHRVEHWVILKQIIIVSCLTLGYYLFKKVAIHRSEESGSFGLRKMGCK